MDIAIAAYASPTNPAFSVSEVVALFPPFRVALTMCLVAWGAAAATAIFEIYGVNYKYLFAGGCLLNGYILNVALVFQVFARY